MSSQSGFQATLGKCLLATGFLLSLGFSLMLLRQAHERHGFVVRIHAVEEKLHEGSNTEFFAPIPRAFPWFTSVVLAWILLVESVAGFFLFLFHLFL